MSGYLCWKCKEPVTLIDLEKKNFKIDYNYLNEQVVFHTPCYEEWLA